MVLTGPAEIVVDLRGRGIAIEAIHGRLKASPASALTDADRVALREYKAQLLTLCASSSTPKGPAARHRTVPTSHEPIPIIPCPDCGGRRWRLRDTPASAGGWLWRCATCADALDGGQGC